MTIRGKDIFSYIELTFQIHKLSNPSLQKQFQILQIMKDNNNNKRFNQQQLKQSQQL